MFSILLLQHSRGTKVFWLKEHCGTNTNHSRSLTVPSRHHDGTFLSLPWLSAECWDIICQACSRFLFIFFTERVPLWWTIHTQSNHHYCVKTSFWTDNPWRCGSTVITPFKWSLSPVISIIPMVLSPHYHLSLAVSAWRDVRRWLLGKLQQLNATSWHLNCDVRVRDGFGGWFFTNGSNWRLK